MDPGRKAIEEREASYLGAGDRILNEFGREFEIVSWSGPDADDQIEFMVKSPHTEAIEPLTLGSDETVRVRVQRSGN